MSSETWEKVVKEEWAKGIDCEARELRAQARDQVPKWRSALPRVMATLGGGERPGVEAKTPGI